MSPKKNLKHHLMHTPHFDHISTDSFYLTLTKIVSNRVNIVKHHQANEKEERKISNRNKKKRGIDF